MFLIDDVKDEYEVEDDKQNDFNAMYVEDVQFPTDGRRPLNHVRMDDDNLYSKVRRRRGGGRARRRARTAQP